MRPKVSFDSRNIWRRLETCKTVAQAYGWPPDEIIKFGREVEQAFSYEDAMAVIERDFDILKRREFETH
jgi:hypothetical protein